jgi:hypothetical protein
LLTPLWQQWRPFDPGALALVSAVPRRTIEGLVEVKNRRHPAMHRVKDVLLIAT